MIKAIALDYGGVIKINETDLFGEICNYLKINRDEWEKEYFNVYYACNVESVSFEKITLDITSKFNNLEEAKNDVLNLLKSSKGKWHLNNELIDLIKDFKNKDYKIALLSNNSIELRQRLREQGIEYLFDEIIISAEVGYQKPQPEIFDILFKKLNVEPNDVVFIDDTLNSLEGADKIGYIPILYKDNETLKNKLSDLLQIELK